MMRDDMETRLDHLFAAAREERPEPEEAERFFEARLMARIRERREARQPWYLMAWRCVPAFALLAAILTVLSLSSARSGSTDLFAAISSGQDDYVARSFISGE
jgi:hypothetical protein